MEKNGKGLTNIFIKNIEKITNAWRIYPHEPIAIIGMSCRLPGNIQTPQEFWDLLKYQKSASTKINEAAAAKHILLKLTWEALETTEINPFSLKHSTTGIYIGSSDATTNTAATQLAYLLGTQGPVNTIDTACSSALVAIFNACQDLHMGGCDLAIAGSVNLMSESETKGHIVAVDGKCKAFDASANGYMTTEGGGIFILKRLSDAVRDNNPILAVIKGAAINQDGEGDKLIAPNVETQVKLLETALQYAGTKPHEIDFIETHGTGTILGDAIEMRAINHVYRNQKDSDNPLYLGAVKTNIGHLESASGIASLIKVVLMLQHKEIIPNLHFENLNPYIDLDAIPAKIPTQPLTWEKNTLRKAAINSLGFTGINAHLILEEALISNQEEPALPTETPTTQVYSFIIKDFKVEASASLQEEAKEPEIVEKSPPRWLIVSSSPPPIEFGRATWLTHNDILSYEDSIMPGVTDVVYVLPEINSPEDFEDIYLCGLLKLVQNLLSLETPLPSLRIITPRAINAFHEAIAEFYNNLQHEHPSLNTSWINTDNLHEWPWLIMKEMKERCVA